MKKTISVIIPTFNRVHTLKRAIDSVLSQTCRDFDLWIIDDGSTDETEDLVKSFNSSEIQIYYLKQENKGVSSARNMGIKRSQGEWIALLDSDDEWLPNRLQKQIELANNNPELPLIHGEEIWVRRGKRVNPKFIHKKFGGDIFERCLPLCLISPSASLIKRSLLEEVGGFDEDFTVCEDYDLWLKVTSLYPVGFIDDPIIIKHGGHEDQLSAKYFAMDYYRILAMDRIISIRELSDSHQLSVRNEIIKKATILLKGYLKHNNMENFDQVCKIAQKYDSGFSISRDTYIKVKRG